jgi:hypothetical protein
MPALVRHRQREFLAKTQPEPPRYGVLDLHPRQIYSVCFDQNPREFVLQRKESIHDF